MAASRARRPPLHEQVAPRSVFAKDAFAGTTAIVTGGTRGIGNGIAHALAHHGARVFVTSRHLDDARRAASEIDGTGEAMGLQLDVTDVGSIRSALEETWAQGGADVLVNNAGINIPEPALEVTEENWDVVQTTNLKGLFFMSQAFARRLVADERPGSVVNMTSQSGLVALDLRAAYCSSKAGVVNLTRELALEWAKHSIRVNAVAPTFVLTPLSGPMLEDETFRAHVLGMIPMGRLPEISEVSDAVLFLASPASSFVTGHTLVVDGGWTIH